MPTSSRSAERLASVHIDPAERGASSGRPHLVPLWFVWHADKVHLGTELGSVKACNLQASPRVRLALEDGSRPVIVEGEATLLNGNVPPEVVAGFLHKYGWDITKIHSTRWWWK